MTVKDIAQLVQAFGSELAETDLPDEADAIELLLRSHTDKYRQMKVAAPGSGVKLGWWSQLWDEFHCCCLLLLWY